MLDIHAQFIKIGFQTIQDKPKKYGEDFETKKMKYSLNNKKIIRFGWPSKVPIDMIKINHCYYCSYHHPLRYYYCYYLLQTWNQILKNVFTDFNFVQLVKCGIISQSNDFKLNPYINWIDHCIQEWFPKLILKEILLHRNKYRK